MPAYTVHTLTGKIIEGKYLMAPSQPTPNPTPLPTVKVGMLWHSMNSDNLGVGALTLSNIDIVERLAAQVGVRPEFIILGWDDAGTPYVTRDDVSVKGLRMKDFLRPKGGLFSALRACDLVLDIGAGDSFTDIYGLKRSLSILGSKVQALATRRPLILCPQTIGPFGRTWVRRLAVGVMNRAYGVTSRDDLSTAFLRDIGYKGTITEATDVAMRLPFTRQSPGAEGPVRVGLNVSGLLMSGGYTGRNDFGLTVDYPALIRQTITWFQAQPNCEVHLVAHVLSESIEVEDDYRASKALADEFPGTVLAPYFKSPIDAKSYISGLDFFAGARMHACIAAFSSDVPMVPMAYSRKFGGLFGTLGYDVLADLRSETTESALAILQDGFIRRDALKADGATAYARALTRLDDYEALVLSALQKAKGQG